MSIPERQAGGSVGQMCCGEQHSNELVCTGGEGCYSLRGNGDGLGFAAAGEGALVWDDLDRPSREAEYEHLSGARWYLDIASLGKTEEWCD